ncbi:MAG: DUF460 domain-containing protein [Candidatus Anstonellaceae archaeon]
MRYYIVGVDSGNTIGLAFLTLDGKVKNVVSFAGSISDAIRIIEEEGKPAIIATDVNPASELTIKLASYFNAKLSFPKKPIRESEKWQLVREYEKKEKKRLCKNLHQRDALSAAIIAYREKQNLLRSSLKTDLEEREKIAYLMLQGYRKETALQIINSEKTNKIEEKKFVELDKQKISKAEENPVMKIEKIIKLKKENLELKKRIELLEQEKKHLLAQIERLKNENYKQICKDREVKKLNFKLKTLKRYLKNKQKTEEEIQTQEKNEEGKNLKELDTDILIRIVQEHRQRK